MLAGGCFRRKITGNIKLVRKKEIKEDVSKSQVIKKKVFSDFLFKHMREKEKEKRRSERENGAKECTV